MKMNSARVLIPSIALSLSFGLVACRVKPIEINSKKSQEKVVDSDTVVDTGPIAGTRNVQQLALGENHSCALINGGVWCWGDNSKGQLGNATVEVAAGSIQANPVRVQGLERDVTAISAGGDRTCAIIQGNLSCWGQVFDDQSSNDFRLPQIVSGSLGRVRSVTVGTNHFCARTEATDRIVCFGNSDLGQLGNGRRENSVDPVNVLIAEGHEFRSSLIVAGDDYTFGVERTEIGASQLRFWGKRLENLGTSNPFETYATEYLNMSGPFGEIAAGKNHICALVPNQNQLQYQVKCIGENRKKQLGRESHEGISPVIHMTLMGGVEKITAGNFFNCVVQHGDVKCWGDNTHGQLGERSGSNVLSATETETATPATVQGLNGYQIHYLTAGANHVCASDSYTIRCWGNNTKGQLGYAPAEATYGAPAVAGRALPSFSARPVEVEFNLFN